MAQGWMAKMMAQASNAASPDQFWQSYLAMVKQAVDASSVDLFVSDGAAWRPMFATSPGFETLVSPSLLQAARAEGVALGQGVILAMVASTDPRREVAMVVTRADAAPAKIAGLAMVPVIYERAREGRLASRDALRLSQALVMLGNLADTRDFNAAAALIVNRLAEMFAAEQVYLTWARAVGQRLAAVSHGDLPQQRSTQAALAEEMAQEALTQQSDVIYPGGQSRNVHQAAARFADLARPGHVIVLPMLEYATQGGIIEHGAIALTRQNPGFTEAEQWALRLFVDMVAQTLVDKSATRQILPLRLWREVARSLPRVLQVKTQAGRILLGGGIAALLLVMLLPVPYSIRASAVLKADAIAYEGAPFDGFIQSSAAQLGDRVQAGDVVVRMAVDQLELEKQSSLAELAQANRDAEINRAQSKLPEMQLAKARAAEIKAQLALLDARIDQAQVKASLSGVVVDGEPSKKLGQAIARGDMLVTIAQVQGLYTVAAVPERDLDLVESGAGARLTLLANPDAEFALTVDRAIPAVAQQDGENVFPVRLSGPVRPADWWLPGMTGVVRIDAGSAPLAWVLTRRMVDQLRLWLWI